jgi:hypothetical protein
VVVEAGLAAAAAAAGVEFYLLVAHPHRAARKRPAGVEEIDDKLEAACTERTISVAALRVCCCVESVMGWVVGVE